MNCPNQSTCLYPKGFSSSLYDCFWEMIYSYSLEAVLRAIKLFLWQLFWNIILEGCEKFLQCSVMMLRQHIWMQSYVMSFHCHKCSCTTCSIYSVYIISYVIVEYFLNSVCAFRMSSWILSYKSVCKTIIYTTLPTIELDESSSNNLSPDTLTMHYCKRVSELRVVFFLIKEQRH